MPKCRTKYCRGWSSKYCHSPYCSRCRTRRWRDNHPIAYHFGKLRSRARERGKVFTLARYTQLWRESGYGERRGKTAESLSVNRIENDKGYTDDNVEVIPLSVNARFKFANIPEYIREQIREAEANST